MTDFKGLALAEYAEAVQWFLYCRISECNVMVWRNSEAGIYTATRSGSPKDNAKHFLTPMEASQSIGKRRRTIDA